MNGYDDDGPGLNWWRIITVIAITCAMLFLLWQLTARHGDAATVTPPTVTLSGPLSNVVCGFGCCCGIVTGGYRGQTYSGAYCRWFRELREGERVTVTGRPNAAGWVR
jgi:hypothetical protein